MPGGPTSDSSWAGLGVAVSACVVAGAAIKMSTAVGDTGSPPPDPDTEQPQPPPSPLAGGRRLTTSPGSNAHQDRGQGGAPSDRKDGAGPGATTEQAAHTAQAAHTEQAAYAEQAASSSGTPTEPEGSEDEGGSGTRLLASAPPSSPASSPTASLPTSPATVSPASSPGILERTTSPDRTRRHRPKRGGPPTSL